VSRDADQREQEEARRLLEIALNRLTREADSRMGSSRGTHP
jgi:hypothetical protein